MSAEARGRSAGTPLGEVLIASWALALTQVLAPFSGAVLGWMGADPSPWWQWTVAFAATFAVLLPATAAMGATLPALERALAMRTRRPVLPALYASNTAGAVLGVLATAFWLVPRFGLARTAWVCVLLNLACGQWHGGFFAGPEWPEPRVATGWRRLTAARRPRPRANGAPRRGRTCRAWPPPACSASATRCWCCACSAR